MRLPLLLFSALLSLSPCLAEDGFVPLVTGDSLAGWVQRGGDASYRLEADAEGRPVVVGTTAADTPNSFLCTERDYADFVLEFEVRVDPSLNSGVQFRSNVYPESRDVTLRSAAGESQRSRRKAGVVHGYQAEIDPSSRAWSGGVYDESRRGWLAKPDREDQADAREAFDPDAWNHYRVEAIGDSIRTFVNGVPVTNVTDGMTPSGFVALQVHSIGNADDVGKEVRWRQLRIKELAEATADGDATGP